MQVLTSEKLHHKSKHSLMSRRSGWLQHSNQSERALSIRRAIRNTMNLEPSSHTDIKKGIGDLKCSYVPDFGYEEV